MSDSNQASPATIAEAATADHQLLTTFLAHNPHAQCPKCLYTLGAINTDKCPECGLSLRLECGPIPRFSTLWLLCFAVMSAVLGFAVFMVGTNYLFKLKYSNLRLSTVFVPLLEFWPMLVAVVLLGPGIAFFTKKQRAFDALPKRFRWPVAVVIFVSGPLLMLFFSMVYP